MASRFGCACRGRRSVTRRGRAISLPRHPPDRAVRAGRRPRHRRAHHCRRGRKAARPVRDRREPYRRQRHRRHAGGRGRRPRRLHVVERTARFRRQSERLQNVAVRYFPRLCPDREYRRQRRLSGDGAPGPAGALHRRADRLRQNPSPVLRLGRRRQYAASGGGFVLRQGRHRDGARAVSRRGSDHDRAARRHGRSDIRFADGCKFRHQRTIARHRIYGGKSRCPNCRTCA